MKITGEALTPGPNELWVPGANLVVPMETPTPDELRAAFAESVMPGSKIVSLEGSLSALALPQRRVRGFAFLDLDDMVGDLSGSLQHLQYGEITPTAERKNNHDYGEGMFFDDAEKDTKFPLYALIRACEAGQRPVDDIDKISRAVMSWRAAGIYTGFITALTPGSELPAVKNFIGRHFRGNCDFVVITSGDYRLVNKGAAAQAVIERIVAPEGAPVVHLDDWPSHTAKVRDTVTKMPGNLNVATFQYEFPSNQVPDKGSKSAKTALSTFDLATEFLADSLARQMAEQPGN